MEGSNIIITAKWMDNMGRMYTCLNPQLESRDYNKMSKNGDGDDGYAAVGDGDDA
jgi:hypothetical protein